MTFLNYLYTLRVDDSADGWHIITSDGMKSDFFPKIYKSSKAAKGMLTKAINEEKDFQILVRLWERL